MKRSPFSILLLSLLLPFGAANAQEGPKEAIEALVASSQEAAEQANPFDNALFPPNTKLISLTINEKTVEVLFNVHLAQRIWTPEQREELKSALRSALGEEMGEDMTVKVRIQYGSGDNAVEHDLDDHILSETHLREREQAGEAMPALEHPVVEHVDYQGPTREHGLANRNIVVGASHGWTWHKENRWQFQRARLFTIIEDMYPMAYINPFLAPMLENAGANVFSVRERDFQRAEVIVDNDEDGGFSTNGEWQVAEDGGWRGGRPAFLDGKTEPFTLGTTQSATLSAQAEAVFTPEIPRDGQYAVYLSWKQDPENSPSVPIRINHLGGRTTVRVNQQVGGGTWVLAGFYQFGQGSDPVRGSVIYTTEGARESYAGGQTTISADAVRFGGGMGNVATGNQISGKPRYAEAARYFLQYAGAPMEMLDVPVEEGHFGHDYNRDIAARSEWANYLQGGKSGPNPLKEKRGLGIPIELYLGWHTDAGIKEDGIYGTLGIYRIAGDNGEATFPDGRSRWLNRDLSALMQEEIVRSSRELYTSSWARRDLREVGFGEVRRPNVPSTILESLSHQNFNDMKYGLDPRYRFDISRAVYKSIVRFVAMRHEYDPIIQPLPPTHLAVRHVQSGIGELVWLAQEDPLEPSATPEGYIVYTSTDGRSFDNGTYTTNTRYRTPPLNENSNYYFRVTAANGGGESFPTSIVGMRWSGGRQPALIVDGFDRVSGPAIVEGSETRGFDRAEDPGVGHHYNYGLVGSMYDFNPESEWKNDLEAPGWGGSTNEWENRLERGNSFNHIVKHGEAFAALDQPFDSATASAFTAEMAGLNYWMIDWIAGRQKTVMPFEGMQNQGEPDRMKPAFSVMDDAAVERLDNFIGRGGKLLLSGAHIAEDLIESSTATRETRRFASRILGIRDFKKNSSTIHFVEPGRSQTRFASLASFRYGKDLGETINMEPTVYSVPSSESFTGRTRSDRQVLQYGDSKFGAALAGESTVILGFPLETVLPEETRTELLRAVLGHFGKDTPREEE